MFDVINGLPVHALVVHAVVVLLPLMSLVTIAFTVRPKWRPGLPWAILGNLGVVGASLVAKRSGEALQSRLVRLLQAPVAENHEHLGEKLPYFAIVLLVASVIAWLLVRPRGESAASRALVAVATVLVLAAGAGASFWTYRVGDSGAQAVWKDTIANTTAK